MGPRAKCKGLVVLFARKEQSLFFEKEQQKTFATLNQGCDGGR
jgi:hypothetical protein